MGGLSLLMDGLWLFHGRIIAFSWADYRGFMGGCFRGAGGNAGGLNDPGGGRASGRDSLTHRENISKLRAFRRKTVFHQKLALFTFVWRRGRFPAIRIEKRKLMLKLPSNSVNFERFSCNIKAFMLKTIPKSSQNRSKIIIKPSQNRPKITLQSSEITSC